MIALRTLFTGVMIGMVSISVSPGLNNNCIGNVIFGGPTSAVLNSTTGTGTDGTVNTHGNFCVGGTINAFWNPLISTTLAPSFLSLPRRN